MVRDRHGASATLAIRKLLDVEEHIWSPRYGLKGNIDATVQVAMEDEQGQSTLAMPLELKTGRNTTSTSHRAQTALYTLLLSDRYGDTSLSRCRSSCSKTRADIEVAYGILYYMENSQMSLITGVRHEILQMVKQRNVLACYVRDRVELPPMLRDPRLCGRCYAQTPCLVYHKLIEDGDADSSGLNQRFSEQVGHLTATHQEFFRKWDELLTKEEADLFKFRRELWTMTSQEREKMGRCFGDLVPVEGLTVELADSSKINRFKYTLKKRDSPYFSFTDSQITLGEPIVISDEEGHYALANGYVVGIKRQQIKVAVDRRLHNARVRDTNFNEQRNQNFVGMMQVSPDGEARPLQSSNSAAEPVRYRLDKDEFSNGMAMARNNLVRIMDNATFGASSLRKLIVEHVPPTFKHLSAEEHTLEPSHSAHLNVDQRKAIKKVMSAKDYALVLGMPGTGKTTTIAQIIRALTSRGKSVLLTSYTHTAVDNILLKIRSDGIEILRIGATAKIHPEVQEFAHLASAPKFSEDELKSSYQSQVVATTCLGINHPVFNERFFDYCIVDEASQITLPVCLGPIRMAKMFVLVGDHYQLPPLVQNKQAQEGGLDISLFKLLSDQHPESVVNLEHQYRMCEDVMSLSNALIYDGRLKCGTAEVACRAVSFPNMAAMKQLHCTPSTLTPGQTQICLGSARGRCWLREALDPLKHVIFLNTDLLLPASREIVKGARITNPVEVAVTNQVVETLLTVGTPASDIGVVTLYRSQLALLKQSIRCHSSSGGSMDHGNTQAGMVEIHTADKFQGRDKEVVVLSLVRSNDANNVGELLQDWRRVNVALTRAKTKLVIVGSFGTMSKGNELLGKLCRMIEQKNWKMDLKPGSLDEHLFDSYGPSISDSALKKGPNSQTNLIEERRGTKTPGKVGKVNPGRLLNSRPILKDIVNDIAG